MSSSTKAARMGEEVWKTRVDKVSAELVTLTYGTIVAQLCKDYEYNYPDVNKQLERMGYNIGIRLIEDFLAKSSAPACTNFREVAEMISKVGFKIFLNITPTITNWSSDNKQFSLIFDENPLADFVELPDDGRAQDELWFSNILVGVLRGALEWYTCKSKHILSATSYEATTPPRCGYRWFGTLTTKCHQMMSREGTLRDEKTMCLHEAQRLLGEGRHV